MKRPRCGPQAVLAVAIVACAAGCGSQSDTDKIKSTVQSYIDGLASQDGKKVCDQLSPSVQSQVKASQKAKDCGTGISNYEKTQNGRDIPPTFKTAKIKSVAVKGSTAAATITFTVTTPEGQTGAPSQTTIPVEKVNGTWKIAGTAGA